MYELAMTHGKLGNREQALRWLGQARQVTVSANRQDLADIIDQDLQTLR